MGIALRLKQFLDEHSVPHAREHHNPKVTSLATARACSFASDDLAKGVLARCMEG